MLAEATGGPDIDSNNDLATAFEAAVADLRASYTLAFYAGEDAGAAWTPLEVKVKRRGSDVRRRSGSGAVPPAPEWNDETVRAPMAAPLGAHAVLLNARCEPY